MKDSALYIHIPFCDHKCIYCDFYSIITSDNIDPFLKTLKKEIDHYSEKYSADRVFSSIYFGGGTPSLMSPQYISEIIEYLNHRFSIRGDAEITLETNPGTVDAQKLKDFHRVGINRLSVGVQSFHNDELKFLTRIHNSETAVETIMNAAASGFQNISLDLIFNLPGQTKQKWAENLDKAVSLPVTHLSTYSLILERGTILNKMVLDKKVILQDEDYDADLYEYTIDCLVDRNFNQYEVSNFCFPGYECRHNNAYWRYRDYLSFGTSAHSFADGKRWWNYSSLKKYIHEININGIAVAGSETINGKQQLDEYVMLALRSAGLDMEDLMEKFGSDWIKEKNDYFIQLKNQNLLEIDDHLIRLTKKGYALCDEILANLL
ncbi:MAG TPA: radical SAM family heme chaperone HemW [Ignavibacteriaceae bacterium]|nr:radical SAM family heme chaperone HemW [Ignavibacteriaceae bacterium]